MEESIHRAKKQRTTTFDAYDSFNDLQTKSLASLIPFIPSFDVPDLQSVKTIPISNENEVLLGTEFNNQL